MSTDKGFICDSYFIEVPPKFPDRTITITAYNRPDYLKHTLDMLSRNRHLEKYLLVCKLELPNKCLEVCKSIGFMNKVICVNRRIQGVRDNPFNALGIVFSRGSMFNIYLEEDIDIAPDAVDMAEWFFALPDVNDYLCMNYFVHGTSDIDAGKIIRTTDGFSALGMCLTRHSWDEHFKTCWGNDIRGWDYSVTNMINEKKLLSLRPVMPRSNHAGKFGGRHCTPEQHDKTFSFVSVYDGPAMKYYIK
jgi:hypothetical protein